MMIMTRAKRVMMIVMMVVMVMPMMTTTIMVVIMMTTMRQCISCIYTRPSLTIDLNVIVPGDLEQGHALRCIYLASLALWMMI